MRVSPNGDSVIAARATPNTDVALMDGDTVIARGKTDASGQVAFLPPALKSGEHSLALAVGSPGRGGAISSQSVAVSVPEQAKTAPMVAVLQPNESAKILSGPVAGAADPARRASPSVAPAALAPSGQSPDSDEAPVAIQSAEAEEQGSFYASGKAVPGSQCHVYLNGSYVASVTADGRGLWSLQINRGMKPGHYAVRVDQVEPKTGKVVARAEVPFDYPVGPVAAAATGETVPEGGDQQFRLPLRSPRPPAQSARQLRPGLPGKPAKGTKPRPGPRPSQDAKPVTANTARRPGAVRTADAGSTSASDADQAAIPTVVNELLTAKVVRGDTLWRISRKMLGHGVRIPRSTRLIPSRSAILA